VSLSILFRITGEIVSDPITSTNITCNDASADVAAAPPTVPPPRDPRAQYVAPVLKTRPIWYRALGTMLLMVGLVELLQSSYVIINVIQHRAIDLDATHSEVTDVIELLGFAGFTQHVDRLASRSYYYLILPILLSLWCLAVTQLVQGFGLLCRKQWVIRWLVYWSLAGLVIHLVDIVTMTNVINSSRYLWDEHVVLMPNMLLRICVLMMYAPGLIDIHSDVVWSIMGFIDQAWPQLIVLGMLCRPSIRKAIKSWS